MPRSDFGYTGRIQVVGGVFSQQPFLGQVRASGAVQSRVGQEPAPPAPEKKEPGKMPFEERPGRRLAWGRLKKLEAKELSDYLAGISDRMRAAGIPQGIVREIKDRLDSFVTTAPPEAEIEITEEQVRELENAILVLEEAEVEKPSGIPTGLIVAGTVVVGVLLLSSL